MHNKLHDELDALEDIRGRTKALVARVLADNISGALERTGGDIHQALALLAQMVELEMAAQTTEAFQAGVGFTRRRRSLRD